MQRLGLPVADPIARGRSSSNWSMPASRKFARRIHVHFEETDPDFPGARDHCCGAQEPVAMTAEDVNAWLDGYLPYALHTATSRMQSWPSLRTKILTERAYGYSDVAKQTLVDPKKTLLPSRLSSPSCCLDCGHATRGAGQDRSRRRTSTSTRLSRFRPATAACHDRNIMQHTAGI